MKTTQTQAKAKAKPATQATQAAKPVATLYRMEVAPLAGRLLRAYFVALIAAQMGGKLQAEKAFKLWPAINLRTHLANARIRKEGGLYYLTAAGYNYFTDPAQQAPAEMVEKFAKAIAKGEAAEIYKGKMLPL